MGNARAQEILTRTAANNASFHERLANVAFAHSLRSDVEVGEMRVTWSVIDSLRRVAFEVVSSSFAGVERHRWVKSIDKLYMHSNGIGIGACSPETHLTMGPLI